MAETSRYWTGTTPGDAGPYTSDQFSDWTANCLIGTDNDSGPLQGSGTAPDIGLSVQQTGVASTSVQITPGAALVNGTLYENSANVSFVISANGSGNPRIDTVVLRKDWALQTIRLAVLTGTPAASPVPATLTQSAGVRWEIPLADVAVASGFISIVQANITPRPNYANISGNIYLLDILNNSGATLVHGDVVVWDTSADRGVKTSTVVGDSTVAGIWLTRANAGGYGRILVKGIGYVNANAAVTRGNQLYHSNTAKTAAIIQQGAIFAAAFAQALQTSTGSGLVLCYVDARIFYANSPDVLRQDTTELSATNTVAETSLGTWTIRGGQMGVNDILRIKHIGSWLQNSGAGATETWRVKIGGTTIFTFSNNTAGGAGSWGYMLDCVIKNAGATNSQKGVGLGLLINQFGQAVTGAVVGTAAIDTTADFTIQITAQSSTATATQTTTGLDTTIEHVKAA